MKKLIVALCILFAGLTYGQSFDNPGIVFWNGPMIWNHTGSFQYWKTFNSAVITPLTNSGMATGTYYYALQHVGPTGDVYDISTNYAVHIPTMSNSVVFTFNPFPYGGYNRLWRGGLPNNYDGFYKVYNESFTDWGTNTLTTGSTNTTFIGPGTPLALYFTPYSYLTVLPSPTNFLNLNLYFVHENLLSGTWTTNQLN